MANEVQVSLENSEGLKRTLRIEVPAEQIDSEILQRLRKIGKQAKIQGFRKGKAPLPVIRKNYGESVKHEVLGDVMQSSYSEALKKEELIPAGNPSIDAGEYKTGSDYVYTATLEVYPEVELSDLSKITAEKQVADIEDADVDVIIENMRHQKSTWETVNRAARENDKVVIDFEGKIDGEVFPGGKAESSPVVIGEGRMLPDFETGIVGIKAGETRNVDVKFPDEYHAEDLRGKTAVFEISAESVEEKALPEMDEEFCKAFGVESGELEQLRTEVRDNMSKELETTIAAKLKDNVMEALLNANELTVPEALVDQEIHNLQHDMMQRMGLPNDHSYHPPRDQFVDEATKRVRLGLILGELVKKAELKVEAEDIDAQLDRLTDGYEDSEAMKNAYRAQQNLMQQVHMMALEMKVVDHVASVGSVTESKVAFQELMNVKPMS